MKKFHVLGTFISDKTGTLVWISYKEKNKFILTKFYIGFTEDIDSFFKVQGSDIQLNHEDSKIFREVDEKSNKDAKEYSNKKLKELNLRDS